MTDTSYSSSCFIHDCRIFTYRDGVVGGNGDVAINWPAPYFTADNDGNPRPVSGPWDIGACEYNTDNVSTGPAGRP